jgi:hypothetical protein
MLPRVPPMCGDWWSFVRERSFRGGLSLSRRPLFPASAKHARVQAVGINVTAQPPDVRAPRFTSTLACARFEAATCGLERVAFLKSPPRSNRRYTCAIRLVRVQRPGVARRGTISTRTIAFTCSPPPRYRTVQRTAANESWRISSPRARADWRLPARNGQVRRSVPT